MKKYTNKILLTTCLTLAALCVLVLTINFQVKYHKDPNQFKAIENHPDMIILEDVDTIQVDTLHVTQSVEL